MLTPKFSVPFALKALNYRTFVKTACSSERNSVHSKDAFVLKKSRCLDYKRALEKCPKASLVKSCEKKMFADNIPHAKCSWSNADDYRRAYEAIKKRSEKLTELLENTMKNILDDVTSNISKIRLDENAFTKRILQSVEPKVFELSNLDPACAMKKKLDVLVLNDRTQRELSNLHYERQLEMESIECDLERLKAELKTRVNSALELISSCRKSKSPQALIDCVENNSREAAEMLDNVKTDFETCIQSIKSANEKTIVEDKKRVREVTEIFEKRMADLISEVIHCIRVRKSS